MKISIAALGIFVLGLAFSCNKTANPTPPVTDTVTLTKTVTDTLVLPPPDDTPNLTKGLVLYLPFTNGSMADFSGFGNTVTPIAGGALGYDMHGYANSAFTSSGNGARLVVSNNGAYAVDTAFAVSFDFTIRSAPYYNGGYPFTGLMSFVSLVDTSDGNGPTFHIGLDVPGEPQYFDFGIGPASNACDNSGAGNPQDLNDTTGFIPQINSWYNAICMFSQGTVSVYINGQLISTKTTTATSVLFCPNANFVVGGWWNSDPENINGEIEQIRFYNQSLNASQIAWLSRNFQPNSTKVAPGLKHGKPVTISGN